ncbi:MAG: class I SAM-dependent methyltransferase [Candidatus Moranbacteria bacterium]|nr:class I SAM-dependent methyltransferase [Candidatus Moranbacteria bacterium]
MSATQDKMFADTASMYDANSEEYATAAKRELRELTLSPSLIEHLGDLSGKRVLDIGCGTGNSSRLTLSCGAREVTGIDISEKEIITAREIDNGKMIAYFVGNAIDDLSNLGKFDLVTAVLSVHYCTDKGMLEKLFSNVQKVLKPGGEFLAVVVPFAEYDGYGVIISSPTGQEGELSNVSLLDFQGHKFLDFDDIYWSEKTYQEVLEKIGFSVEWLPCIVAEEGIQKYGESFWKKFLDDPIYKIFLAK